MMKKVLLIGSGAREHVIAETLKRSSMGIELACFGQVHNPGIMPFCAHYEVGDITKAKDIAQFAHYLDIDYAISGPEAPLAAGVADALALFNIQTVGPSQNLARLESSKSFARELIFRHKIAGNPYYKICTSEKDVKDWIEELKGNFVVKADNLKGGKGVKVSGEHLKTNAEGVKYAKKCIQEIGKVVIEEKLIGQEFTLLSVTDGDTIFDFPLVQDHKRAYERDTGPNTGGMGSYSTSDHLLPFLNKKDVEAAHKITEQVVQALFEETNEKYRGIIYGGFMATKDGVKLIEYNVRFGDPESMNVLPILKTDFGLLLESILKGELSFMDLICERKATVCKYAVPKGYPDNPLKGAKIEIPPTKNKVKVYYSSVDQRPDGLYLGGARAICVTGIENTLEEAEENAEEFMRKIKGSIFHRSDIGTQALIDLRVKMMKELRKGRE